MKTLRIAIVVVFTSVVSTGLFSQQPFGLTDTLRLDPKITQGRFANGLTYLHQSE